VGLPSIRGAGDESDHGATGDEPPVRPAGRSIAPPGSGAPQSVPPPANGNGRLQQHAAEPV